MTNRMWVTGAVAATLLLTGCLADDGIDAVTEPEDTALTQAYDECSDSALSLGDEGHTLTIDGGAGSAGLEETVCVLLAIEAPDSVIQLMSNTTALQGRQEQGWDDFNASWTYHPDNGLDIVLTEE